MPGCVTAKVWPPIVRLALRVVVQVFAAALKATEPSPDPVAPVVTVSHGAPLEEVQAQPRDEITAITPVPPALGTVCPAGEIP